MQQVSEMLMNIEKTVSMCEILLRASGEQYEQEGDHGSDIWSLLSAEKPSDGNLYVMTRFRFMHQQTLLINLIGKIQLCHSLRTIFIRRSSAVMRL